MGLLQIILVSVLALTAGILLHFFFHCVARSAA